MHFCNLTAARSLVLVAAFSGFLTSGSCLQAQSYIAIDLGAFGGSDSAAMGINNSGEVTGYSSTAAGSTVVFLYANGTTTNLGSLGGSTGWGTSINSSGQIAGFSSPEDFVPLHAFLDANGSMTDLGTLGGSTSHAYGIDDQGQVVGSSTTLQDDDTNAFAYTNGAMVGLGTLGGSDSYAYAINASGQITGNSYTAGNHSNHAFLYANGMMQDLGALGNSASVGTAINAAGQVAGWSVAENAVAHAFLYSDGVMNDLDPASTTNIYAYGINSFTQVVGDSDASGGFLYTNGTMYDLKSLCTNSGVLSVEIAGLGNLINDWGQIAAYGDVAPNVSHALLLNPVDPNTALTGVNGVTIRDTRFVAGMNYAKFIPTTNDLPGSQGTTVSLLDGTAGSSGAGIYGENRDVIVTVTGTSSSGLASDIVNVVGLDGATFDDVIVLQLTYSAGVAGTAIQLDERVDADWMRAVTGNSSVGSLAGFYAMSYADFLATHGNVFDSSSMLGAYGIDPSNYAAWAVVDHGGDFAVVATTVPEPAAWGIMAGASLFGLVMLRHREKNQASRGASC